MSDQGDGSGEWTLPSPEIFARGDTTAVNPGGAELTFAGLWRDSNFGSAFDADRLTVPVGVDDDGHAAFAELSNDAILLVSGPHEPGRRSALRCILAGVSMGATPRDVQLLLTDFGGDGYGDLAKVPHVADAPIIDPREAVHLLTDQMTEVNTRLDEMARAGVRNINRLDPDSRPPRIVIVIDEVLSLLRTDEASTQQSLSFLAGRGRSAGVHTILATGAPLSMLDFVASNVTEQIAFDASLISGSRVPSSALPDGRLGPGEFLWEPMEATYPHRRRLVSVTPDEAAALNAHWRRQSPR